MPTLECLDERTKAILDRLEQMDDRFTDNFKDFRFAIEERNKLVDRRLNGLEEAVLKIQLQRAEEAGKKSVIVGIGAIALTAIASILGAVGNAIYSWWIKH